MGTEYGFDIDSHEVSDYELLPEGTHNVICTKEKWVAASSGAEALVVTFEATDGDNKGLSINDWHNLNHDKEQVRNIAKDSLKKTFMAMDRTQKDGLVGGKCVIIVGKQKKDPERLEIKKYLPFEKTPDGESPF